jgi:hypothetical protein
MDRSYGTYVRYLRLLIARAKTFSDRNRVTKESELHRLKSGAETCLALLSPDVEKLYRQVTELDFYIPFSGGRFGRKILLDPHAYATRDQLLFLLRAALRKVQDRKYAPSPASGTPLGDPGSDRSRPQSYSPADAKLFELIGPEPFRSLTNPELFRRYRRRAEARLGRLPPDAFRARLNRIRKHHGFPSSMEVRKKVTSLLTRTDQD